MNNCTNSNNAEYEKIDLAGNFFKALGLSSEEASIIKKYIFYARSVPDYDDLDKLTLSHVLEYLLQIIFDVYTRGYAFHILEHLGNDLAKGELDAVTRALSSISRSISYADEYKKDKKE